MKWEDQRESSNVEDRRSGGGGGGFGLPIGRGGLGIGTIVIAFVAAWIFGINPFTLLGMLSGEAPPAPPPQSAPQGGPQGPTAGVTAQDANAKFVSVVLASTEDVWRGIFQRAGAQYQPPRLVLYSGRTNTACGLGEAAAGPFYCPGDQKVYVDLRFYQLMKDKLGAAGDTAQAYVIAHEVGHHIQNLMGTMEKMQASRQRMGEQQYNALSVRLELQADCYAGVWAFHSQQAKNWFEAGDLEEAINAAAAVGDDNIQRRTQGVVVPESFTHGSSQQRVRWFKTGLQGGRIDQCDTFSVRN